MNLLHKIRVKLVTDKSFRRVISLKSLTVLLCIFSLLCLYSATLALELNPDEFMAVDEIKPGMKGIGKTVFEGAKIEEFQIEVLEVVKNVIGPKSDIIWVLCSGSPLEETGVMSGMSGSPVYIDGKLIGAMAYRLGTFAKRPVAGVTPIADMLEVLEEESAGSAEHTGTGAWSYPEQAGSMFYNKQAGSLSYESEMSVLPSEGNPASMVPIQMPVMMAGFHPRAIKDITPVLRKFGMTPIQGGGTPSQTELEEVSLEPGAVLGVEFVRGDASVFASGTLTYVHGDKVLAFGHPMVGMGKTSLPMSGGRVTLLLSSLMASDKLASPVKTMGTLIYDSQHAVMGIIGKQPEFIPMKIRINSREYNFEIAKHKLFSPSYIFLTVITAIYNAEKSMGDYTMRIHSEISLKGYPTISKDNIFSGSSPSMVASELAAPLYPLMRNSFEEADVESVLLEISFEDKRTNARIDGVWINKDQIRPGDSLEVTVFLTPYMEDTVTKRFTVAIPKDTPEGRSLLRISDASSSYSWEISRAPMISVATDLPHLVQQIREEESNNDIIVELFAPKMGVTIGDQELPALPLTAFSVMSSPKQAGGIGLTRGTTFLKQRIHTDYVISGSAMLSLNIDRDAP